MRKPEATSTAAVAPTWDEGPLAGAIRAKSGSNTRSDESDRAESARLAVILALWCAIWLTLLSTVSLSPPQDNVEQLTWVRSLQWGYYKHPPLPTILLWPWVHLFGLHAYVTYVLGALMTVSAICVCWRLVRHTSGAHLAWLSTLGTLCITYYNGRLDYYNHNIVLLLLVTVSAYYCWQAFARQSLVAWAGVGLALGLGAITKYQVVLVVVSVVCVWTVQGGWRLPVHRRGLALAMAIALFIFLPHGLWLLEHDFPPIRYALTTSLAADLPAQSRLFTTMAWMADQLSRLLPALLLGAAGLFSRRSATRRLIDDPEPTRQPTAQARVFLFSFGALPLLLIAASGITHGVALQRQWGTAFMPLSCAWLLTIGGAQRWDGVSKGAVLKGFVAVQALLLAINWATSPMGPSATMKKHNRNFPSEAIADALARDTRSVLNGPICILAGPSRLASMVALRLPERPLVLLEGRVDYSPWVTQSPGSRCNIVWLGDTPIDTGQGPSDRHALPAGFWWAVAESPDNASSPPAPLRSVFPSHEPSAP